MHQDGITLSSELTIWDEEAGVLIEFADKAISAGPCKTKLFLILLRIVKELMRMIILKSG